MEKIDLKFVLTADNAVLPQRNFETDTGYDIYATENVLIPARGSAVVPIGLTLAYITPGYWLKVEARSGLGFKFGIYPHFGVIDQNYRGDLGIKLYNNTDEDYWIYEGKCPAQLVIYKRYDAQISSASEVSPTDRGDKGFNSSNR